MNNNIKNIIVVIAIIACVLLLSEYSISKKENDDVYKVVYHNEQEKIRICGEKFTVSDYIADDEILLDMLLSNIEETCITYRK